VGKTPAGKWLIEAIEEATVAQLIAPTESARLLRQVPRIQVPYNLGPVGSIASLFLIATSTIQPEIIETDLTDFPADFDLGQRLQAMDVQIQNPLFWTEQGTFNMDWPQAAEQAAREQSKAARTAIKEDCANCIRRARWKNDNPRISIKIRTQKRF